MRERCSQLEADQLVDVGSHRTEAVAPSEDEPGDMVTRQQDERTYTTL